VYVVPDKLQSIWDLHSNTKYNPALELIASHKLKDKRMDDTSLAVATPAAAPTSSSPSDSLQQD
jgi:hypothetical protein